MKERGKLWSPGAALISGGRGPPPQKNQDPGRVQRRDLAICFGFFYSQDTVQDRVF